MKTLLSPSILNQTITYSTARFPFKAYIAYMFRVHPDYLEGLSVETELITRETDQSTTMHSLYYSLNADFLKLYEAFIHDVIKPLFGEDIVYQRVPTFRVQFPNNKGVGEFHRDSDYHHNPAEINFFLPFTDAQDSSAIWIETEPGKEDYYPMNAGYGQVVMFNGCHLKHGNKINKTGKTRISVDFRVIPLSQYQEETGKTSINTKMRFRIGEYYACTC